ncbi:porin [Janthinobacterium fluminis]|uniref:Porin n=1 Tax=Janthinobacterium fluminis TaxID=2987524 RepID=A0ABT5K1P3_9BURK|nr:porin [Janthinobacterium fluminis]MDC8757677.1 porin [Janthinobacterium fluminis]
MLPDWAGISVICPVGNALCNCTILSTSCREFQVKKLTLAALIIGGFAASAQAQSNVTVYGVVDLGLAKSSGTSAVQRENHASRLGFKGSEDLGNGLSAIFNLESEIKADTGEQKGGLFDRQATIGLKGSFGTVRLGRTKDLVDGAQTRVEPFNADGVVGKVNESMMRVGVSDSRVSNAITYDSPNMEGFVASAQYVLSEIKDADAGYSALLTYDNGPFSAHAGYERAAQKVANSAKPSMYVIGGGYKFGDAKITAAYAKGDSKDVKKGKQNAFLLGLSYTIGQGDAKVVYGKGKQTIAGKSDIDTVKEFGLGYDYHLSKRTDLYAYAGRERVKEMTSYQLGISHKF